LQIGRGVANGRTLSQLAVIGRKYVFSHSTAPRIFTFLSRTPFLVAYIMWTLFSHIGGRAHFGAIQTIQRNFYLIARPKLPLAVT
jgi:hypothetical protein